MEKKSFFRKLIVVSLVIMLLVLVFLGVYYVENQPKVLYPGEIRDYQGQNLSSISDVGKTPLREHNTLTFQPTA